MIDSAPPATIDPLDGLSVAQGTIAPALLVTVTTSGAFQLTGALLPVLSSVTDTGGVIAPELQSYVAVVGEIVNAITGTGVAVASDPGWGVAVGPGAVVADAVAATGGVAVASATAPVAVGAGGAVGAPGPTTPI